MSDNYQNQITICARVKDTWQPLIGLREATITATRSCYNFRHQKNQAWESLACGEAGIEISCSGALNESQTLQFFFRMLTNAQPEQLSFYPITNQAWSGKFLCAKMEILRKFNEEQTFEFLFKSDGKITVAQQTSS